ncbi:patatin-like phospholipase family protein [Sulfurimicrobium lacus]|uniref:patatin-like phospholipase family protein n=1 Tax=Sulfurimicrobium lacus TaxID=2715678 RepID=UPI001FCEC981|nr:patatin-like phospholipase family protein [Sulfurimicrobium lacus]
MALFAVVLFVMAGCAVAPKSKVVEPPTVVVAPKIALVLGGGAARGFAHVGVIKTLEAHGIVPQIVVGTSAGSVVGALYAGGYSGFDLQTISFQMDEGSVGDWVMPDRGFIKGEQLQNFVNRALHNKPIERLGKTFAAVATDLRSGEQAVFRRGNTGMAVRASSSVPGVFQPVTINGREYVDGGLTSPVPVKVARSLGADIVIAVDISSKPANAKVNDSLDVLLQTFSIMGQSISQYELAQADVVIRPNTAGIGSTDFEQKHQAIMEGERAALAALPLIRSLIQRGAGK